MEMSLTWRRVGGIRLICFPISTGGVGGKRIHIHQIHNSTPGDEINFEILLRGLQKRVLRRQLQKNLIRSQLLLSSKEDLITQSLMWYTSGTMVYHGILCFLSGIIEQIKVHLTGSDGFMRCFEMMPSSMVRPAASMAVVAMTSLAGV